MCAHQIAQSDGRTDLFAGIGADAGPWDRATSPFLKPSTRSFFRLFEFRPPLPESKSRFSSSSSSCSFFSLFRSAGSPAATNMDSTSTAHCTKYKRKT